ncbi:unnamed protein product [Absidia cylindrospora]
MNPAYKKGNNTDILATNIALRITRKRDTYMIEDTFVHLLLDDLFSTEQVFYQSWKSSSGILNTNET